MLEKRLCDLKYFMVGVCVFLYKINIAPNLCKMKKKGSSILTGLDGEAMIESGVWNSRFILKRKNG